MLTNCGKPCVVNNPTFDFAQMKQGGQGVMTNRAQERTITPGYDGDEVIQRLMFGAEVIRINPRCNRLNTFSLALQEQPYKIISKGLDVISVIKLVAQKRKVIFKPLFAGLN